MHEFRNAGKELLKGLEAGLYQAAIAIMRVSQGEVPVDTSVLKSSGRVMEPVMVGTTMVCTLGYGYGDEINPKTGERAAGYAIPVHERIEVRHDPPTKAKYLEDPVYRYIKDYEPTLGAAITRAVKSPTGIRTFLEELRHDASLL